VHTLDLSRCKHITDVSALGGVQVLDISRCFGVTDVSALGKVRTLNLEGCNQIKKYWTSDCDGNNILNTSIHSIRFVNGTIEKASFGCL
jgi:hypothetical protein